MTIETANAIGRVDGSRGIIDFYGRVDRSSEGPLDTAYVGATAGEIDTLVLDFTEVEYINSTGIAVIVGVLAKARKDSLDVIAHGLTDHYKHIFQITRLADFMKIEDEGGAA